MQFSILLSFIIFGTWGTLVGSATVDQKKLAEGLASTDRIVALPGQFPWQAAITTKVKREYIFWCTGALISDRWIVAATSCLFNDFPITVILGSNKYDEITSQQLAIVVASIHYHPDYVGFVNENNIALLDLGKSLTFNAFIQPIRLSNTVLNGRVNATSSGWQSSSNLLSYVNLQTITIASCNTSYDGIIVETEVCAQSNDDDMFIGKENVGNPLVLNLFSDPELAGIGSLIDQDNRVNVPKIFTRITPYREWMKSIIGF